eukprot:7556989-Pyramimonas_sp.AAC.1
MQQHIIASFFPTKVAPMDVKVAVDEWRKYAQGDVRLFCTSAMVATLETISKLFLDLSEKRAPTGAPSLFQSSDWMRLVGKHLLYFVR